MALADNYYPQLNDIIPDLSKILPNGLIPDTQAIIDEFQSNLLNDVYYKDLIVSKSKFGDNGFYSIVLVSYEVIAITIPGTKSDQGDNEGLKLAINPVYVNSGSTITAYPLELSYEWEVFKYWTLFKKVFNTLSDFDPGNLKHFYDLLIEFAEVKTGDLLFEVVRVFYYESGSNPFEDFVNDFNAQSNVDDLTLNSNNYGDAFDAINDLVDQIYDSSNNITVKKLTEFIYNDLISSSDFNTGFDQLKSLFNRWFGDFNSKDIEDILTPWFSMAMEELEVSLIFPKSILKPVDKDGAVIQDENSEITYEVGALVYDSKKGFYYNKKGTIDFTRSQILDTEIILNIQDLKLDLRKDQNIPEADNAGFSSSFTGFYAELLTIEFPQFWQENGNSTGQLTGRDILIGGGKEEGEELSFTGIIEMEALNSGDDSPFLDINLLNDQFQLTVNTFQIEFVRNDVVNSDVSGTLKIPGIKDSNGDPIDLDFTVDWSKDGYDIVVSKPSGVLIQIQDIVEIELWELRIAREKGEWKFGINGRLERLIDIPKIGDIIPQYIIADPFLLQSDDKTEFDLTLGWGDIEAGISNMKSGLDVDFEYTKDIKIDKTFLDALTLKILHLKFYTPNQSQGLSIDTTLDASLTLGPITGRVGGIGFNTEITFPNGGGNIGPANAEFAFIKPDSIGLSLDVKGFKGGGYIKKMDEDGKVYAGIFDVEFAGKFGVSIMGILALERPEDPNGFSLIGLFSVDAMIPLGGGFFIESLGGVIGLHRTMYTQVLRTSVREDTLDQLLFPENPVENANQIIGMMRKGFPIAEDQFVFGPMAVITYGSVISGEVGLLIEFDDPTRIVILGVVQSILPKEEMAQMGINASFIGEINFGKKRIMFDASLFDSRLLKYTLDGDMIYRHFYGEDSAFIFSIGGFHPSFQPPKNVPLPQKIRRLFITLVDDSVRTIWAKTYFALTSNTVQFGAHVHNELNIAVFEITGDLKMDVLIFFRPEFHFIAKISASYDIKAKLEVDVPLLGKVSKSFSVAGIYIMVKFRGPSPFHLNGKAKVDFGKLSKKVKINETFGEEESTSLPTTNVLNAIADSLKTSNEPFEAIKPEWIQDMVRFTKEGPSTSDSGSPDLVVDPMGNLRVKQLVAPLNVRLKRFNNGQVEGPDTLTIKYLEFGNNGDKVEGDNLKWVQGEFAPNQFFKKDKAELVDAPAYKEYDAGVETNREADNLDTSCIRVKTGTYTKTVFTDTVKYRRRNMIFEEDTALQVANSVHVAYDNVQSAGQFAMAGAPEQTAVNSIGWGIRDSEGTAVETGIATKEEAEDRAANLQAQEDQAGTGKAFTVEGGF